MILLGEYAVLEGAPALVCAVDCHALVKQQFNRQREFSVTSPVIGANISPFVISETGKITFHPGVPAETVKKLGFFKSLFECLYKEAGTYNIEIKPADIDLDTSQFYSAEWRAKFGFGSSAALAVALTAAFLQGSAMDNPEPVFKTTLKTHHFAQGEMGSGIDVAASVYGGILLYTMNKPDAADFIFPRRLKERQDIFMMPVWTGKSANTRQMVGGVGQLKKNQPRLYDKMMNELIRISEKGCNAYENGSAEAFLECIDTFRDTLAGLGEQSGMPIVSEAHRKIQAVCSKQGVHYKPSGAGGGDIGTAFSTDKDRLINVAKDLEFYGFRPLERKIEGKGYQTNQKN